MDWLASAWDFLCRFIYEAWSGFGWPHAALLIVIIVVRCFSAELKMALQRINKLGQWAEFQPMSEATQPNITTSEQEHESNGERLASETVTYVGVASNLPFIPFPESMSSAKQSLIFEIAALGEQDAKAYLIDNLAYCRVTADFEYISGVIYGGQLTFLKALNDKGAFGTSLFDARNLWVNFQATIKPNFDGWAVEQYLNFLIVKGLSVFNGDTYYITPKGRELISWMIHYGRPLQRAL